MKIMFMILKKCSIYRKKTKSSLTSTENDRWKIIDAANKRKDET